MITLPEYKVMGEDGKEYGPVTAEQIRAWFADKRVERKTPLKPDGERDWVFLESLPEFTDLFTPPPPPPPKVPPRKEFIVALVVAVVIVLIYFIFKHARY